MKKVLLAITAMVVLIAITVMAVSAAEMPFVDVKSGWYYNAVQFCYNNSYMSGTDATHFSPTMKLSRAMTVTILSAIDGVDKTQYAGRHTFPDVAPSKWYATSVEWAYEKGIATGYGNSFGPDDSITREQFAVMLMAYARYISLDTSARVENLDTRFKDSGDIHAWAKDALSWAVANDIISGTNTGEVKPRNTATRAEAAVMLYKFALFIGIDADSFTVSRAFGDHMTIQRDKQFAVWGWADASEEGKTVTVEFKGETAKGLVKNGEWKAVFDKTFAASADPAVIAVKGSDKAQKVEFNDVLVGDVYYIMGQSNVYWSMGLLEKDLTTKHRLSEISGVNYSNSTNIRLFRNSHVFQSTKTGEDAWGTSKVYKDVDSAYAVWARPSDFNNTIPYDMNTEFVGGRAFSAVGYLFAFNLSKKTDVPIAMIEIDASGYPLTAFAPNELADKWKSDVVDTETDVHYMCVNGVVYPLHSRMAFNQQIYPLMQFSCAGIVWYQGESDMINTILNCGKDKYSFSTEIVELMQYFRANFGAGDDEFPVYFIEFPSCYSTNSANQYLETGIVRSELGTVPMHLTNSYVVASSDVWKDELWENNIHPYCKPAQARLLASMVLANGYETGDINYVAGPQVIDVEYVDDRTVILTYNYVGDGLLSAIEDESETLIGFDVLTSPRNYSTWAEVEAAEIIAPNKVKIAYDAPIYGVRYNAVTSDSFPETLKLMNSEGVPAIAFADYKNDLSFS